MSGQAELPIVTCPGCAVAMRAVVAQPFEGGQLRIVYRCDKCTTETARVIKPEASPSPQASSTRHRSKAS